jgi:hypothetical protein
MGKDKGQVSGRSILYFEKVAETLLEREETFTLQESIFVLPATNPLGFQLHRMLC